MISNEEDNVGMTSVSAFLKRANLQVLLSLSTGFIIGMTVFLFPSNLRMVTHPNVVVAGLSAISFLSCAVGLIWAAWGWRGLLKVKAKRVAYCRDALSEADRHRNECQMCALEWMDSAVFTNLCKDVEDAALRVKLCPSSDNFIQAQNSSDVLLQVISKYACVDAPTVVEGN